MAVILNHTEVVDSSQVPEARKLAASAATEAGFDIDQVSRVELVTTELAENLHRHAVGGALFLQANAGHLAAIAVDRGPGVRNFNRLLRDGYSTQGTMGGGLGAAVRHSDGFEVVSEPGIGTIVRVDFGSTDPSPVDVAGFGAPLDVEEVNGDTWAWANSGDSVVLMLADGLGHGPDAAAASVTAAEALPALSRLPIDSVVTGLHEELRPTRGAALAVAEFSLAALAEGGVVTVAGLGNIGVLLSDRSGESKRILTQSGTAGATAPSKILPQRMDVGPHSAVVLHSDGLRMTTSLRGRGRLLEHSALVVAAALWRDFARTTDDTSVLVAKPAA